MAETKLIADGDKFYVYLYRDPRAGKADCPIYVGKGSVRMSSPQSIHRALRHWRSDTHNALLSRILSKIRSCELEPKIEIVGRFSLEVDAFGLERELIHKYGRRDLKRGPLCNMTDGGEGASGYLYSDQQKQDRRVRRIGKKHSVETLRRMSESLRGKKPSELTREKLSAANKGRPLSDDHKAKLRAKALLRPPVTAEVREKLRRAALGVPKSAETLEKIRVANLGNKRSLGQKQSLATRLKRSVSMTGKRHSPETCEKIRILKLGKKNPRKKSSGCQVTGPSQPTI
jgi:hypothetical protein